MPAKKKTTTKRSRPATEARPRRIQRPHYKSFRVSKRIRHPGETLSPSYKLLWRSLKHQVRYWKIFLGISAVYAVLSLLLVRGLGATSTIPQTKELLQGLFQGAAGKLASGLTLFGVLVGNNATASDAASAYQSMLVVVVSLALIWAFRQTYSATKIRIRDAFYKGLYPLVPFVLVVMIIGLQLVPLLFANMLYGFVFGNGIAVTVLEKVLWGMLFFLMGLLTLYMVTSSIFALYIVALPDVAPLQALRSARELVRYRRWTIMRKLVFLPIILMVIAAIIVVPIILFVTPVAEWVYFALTMIALSVLNGYMYALYRELIA